MTEQEQPGFVIDSAAPLLYKGVIFDMDGTLIVSTEADYLAWKRVFNDYGKPLSFDQYHPLLGIRSTNVVKAHLGVMAEEEVKKILKDKLDYFTQIIAANPIKPVLAAEAFLKSMANYPVKVALATSSRKEKMELVLKQLNFLQYFDVIVTGDEVENSKPAPDIFLLAAKRLGLSANECVVVEDGPAGVAAAKKAKMKCVAITETHTFDRLHEADLVINSYENADFLEISRKLAGIS